MMNQKIMNDWVVLTIVMSSETARCLSGIERGGVEGNGRNGLIC